MEYLHKHQKLVQTAPRLNRNNCHMGAAPQIFIQRNYPSSHTLYKETMEPSYVPFTPSQICNIPARNEPMNDVWKWWKLDFPTWKVLHSEGSFLHIFIAVNGAIHSPYDLENSSKNPPIRTSTLTRKSGKYPRAGSHLSPKPCRDQCQAIFPTKEQSHHKPLSPFSSSKLGY